MKKTKTPNEAIKSTDPNVVDLVKKEFFINKAEILVFDDIVPLLDNIEFVDFIAENTIPFTSIKNMDVADAFSRTLMHLSNKLKNMHNLGKIMTSSADNFAKKMGPTFDKLHEDGFESLRSKAIELNRRKIKTLRGKDTWSPTAVKNTYERWQRLKAEEEEKGKNANNPKQLKP